MSDLTLSNGRFQHKGRTYLTAEVSGFNYMYLKSYRKRKHPALKRRMRWIRRRFVDRPRYLYDQEDLQTIRDARNRVAFTSGNGATWPTVDEGAVSSGIKADTLYYMVETGKIRKVDDIVPRRVQRKKGKRTTYTRYSPSMRLCPEDLTKVAQPDTADLISLTEAARQSGIPYETWYWWTTLETCPPLGAKLHGLEHLGKCKDARRRLTNHIRSSDYETIVDRLQKAPRGRVVDKTGKAWLCLAAAKDEFNVPKHWQPIQLQRRCRHQEGCYLDLQNRWVMRTVYHEDDLAAAFTRRKPAPPATTFKPQPNGHPPATSQPVPPAKPKKQGGRPIDPKVEEVQKYCYDRWIKGDKLSQIREGARARFGEDRAPTEDSHVTELAKRYAARKGLPVNRKT
jgi:hypothetical protein